MGSVGVVNDMSLASRRLEDSMASLALDYATLLVGTKIETKTKDSNVRGQDQNQDSA